MALYLLRDASAFARDESKSMISVGLSGRHHRHAGDPAWNRFVEFLLHLEVAARREGAEGGNPCQDFVGAAPRGATPLVGVERVGPPDLTAAQDVHEFLVPFRIERLARPLASF